MEGVYEELLNWSSEEQAKYLRGFSDGESGPSFCRYTHRKGHHVPGEPHVRAVDVANSDKRLLNTVQRVLRNLGIKSKICLDVEKGKRRASIDGWRLKILDREGIATYAEVVGFTNPEKCPSSSR